MPRPKSPDPRTEIIALRLTLSEVVKLHRLADANGITPSALVRALIASATKRGRKKGRRSRTPITPPRQRTITIIEPHRLDSKSYHSIRQLGVNLNQIAKHCNTFGYPPPELAPLLTEIRAVLSDAIAPRPTGAARKRPARRGAKAA